MTLIELLMVMLIVGILAAALIWRVREPVRNAHLASLRSDLRSLTLAQELYYQTASEYAVLEELTGFRPSEGVSVAITKVDRNAYGATGEHVSVPGVTCAVFRGQSAAGAAPPAAVDNVIACE